MTTIEKARALAVAAGVDPAAVAGEPTEVTPWPGDMNVVWGTCPMPEESEVRLSDDVFTWRGEACWSVWVPVEHTTVRTLGA